MSAPPSDHPSGLAQARGTIAPETTVGPIELTVADLERSLAYYTEAIGLRVRERSGAVARLGTERRELLVLHEEPGARPVRGHTGLYHFALLLPDRVELARWLAHAAHARVPLTGMSDHRFSEAIYLGDPDGHGIEIYRDRPRDRWPELGALASRPMPLDVASLLGELDDPDGEGFEGMDAHARMGHVHLHVAGLEATEAFYAGTLGLEVTFRMGDQAIFLSAGGYHHHIAGNTWAGRGATPPPPGSAALRRATIVLPDEAERDRVAARVAEGGQEPVPVDGGLLVRDHSANALLLRAAERS